MSIIIKCADFDTQDSVRYMISQSRIEGILDAYAIERPVGDSHHNCVRLNLAKGANPTKALKEAIDILNKGQPRVTPVSTDRLSVYSRYDDYDEQGPVQRDSVTLTSADLEALRKGENSPELSDKLLNFNETLGYTAAQGKHTAAILAEGVRGGMIRAKAGDAKS